ncbi:MAG: hypoxanthine phosphoribosyltransferase [Chloroflexi bacterium]|nr:hypoxanthine phosphoribosyltransferase [Chloroflexota bacterium]
MSISPIPAGILFSAEQIQERVVALGAQLTHDYADKNPLIVGILRGGVVFLADLMRQIRVPCEMDFISVASYETGARSSSRSPRILLDLREDIAGRHVLLVEDIVDSGYTFDHLLQMLATREPASLKVCALLNKPSRREVLVPIDYLGFEIPDHFVCGYGIDADEQFRNLPYIAWVQS